MSSRKKGRPARHRVGRVSVYFHHGAWWVYYRDAGRPVRRKVAATKDEAVRVAAQVNAQLAAGAPTLLAFTPVSVAALRDEFLIYHEHVLNSSLATVTRYRAATRHLADFAARQPRPPLAHDVNPDRFVAHLRVVEVAPNGHPNTARRRLRDKGVQFILETCRAMYAFAAKRRHLPPYAGNPFAELPLDRMTITDAKPIFVFDAATELAFLMSASPWAGPIHFTLAKTGLRVGELTHLLIEDLDLAAGWLHVRNKTALGWRIKTGSERSVPVLPEGVAVLRRVIGPRRSGPVFLRESFERGTTPALSGDHRELERVCLQRQEGSGSGASRADALRVARSVWKDAGAVRADDVRASFVRTMAALGRPDATCPKSWRHTFATLLQDANVDPLVRQITLGHRPPGGGLGMTANYTHTRPETQRGQIEAALRRWPASLAWAAGVAKGGAR
ncbi:tyrosine-type recombinase/integrase [Fimbriiglobus ruber]|uniref:tyrosine-type recombinase/integrase n=1 Tax=Fimbriiglobus ruber TaxID=1908690 RepID=UPI000B4AB725|nr:site-specific integrase [Fimbriiglobus ruber]